MTSCGSHFISEGKNVMEYLNGTKIYSGTLRLICIVPSDPNLHHS